MSLECRVALHDGRPDENDFEKSIIDSVQFGAWLVFGGQALNNASVVFKAPRTACAWCVTVEQDGEQIFMTTHELGFSMGKGDTLTLDPGWLHFPSNFFKPPKAPRPELNEPPASQAPWKAWRDVLSRPGECACGIERSRCEYHR